MPPTPSIDNDKISFNSAEYEMLDGRTSPVSALEEGTGTFNSHLTIPEKSQSRNTELRRALDERHVNMIAFSTTVGVGCFLQSGQVIAAIGPGGAVMAYLIMGFIVTSANAGLGEITAVFPVKGPIIDFCSRFVDTSIGFAVGWIAWFAYCMLVATEVSAVASSFNFSIDPAYLRSLRYPEETVEWGFGKTTSPAIWATFALAGMLCINVLPVRIYGEIEYFFGCIKIIFMVLMIMFNAIMSGVNASSTTHGYKRFWTYRDNLGFFTNSYDLQKGHHVLYGSSARLVALWSSMTTLFFSLQGVFSVSVSAAENRRLETEETIKIATRKIALRAVLLYSFLIFTVGLNVPYDDAQLKIAAVSGINRGSNSPYILACIYGHVKTLPSILNAFFIFSAFSCGVNGLYTASRLLHALASVRNAWPVGLYWLKARLERTTSKGVPLAAVCASWLFGLLGFLGTNASPAVVLGRLQTLSISGMMIVYMFMGITFIYFKTVTVEAEPIDPVLMDSENGQILNRAAAQYPYRSHLQWARAAFAAFACLLFLIFHGWHSIITPFSGADFVATYIPIPIFLILVALYHIKDERTLKFWEWTRRATMDVSGPTETTQTNPLLRRGRLHRANVKRFWTRENLLIFRDFIWVWLK